MRFESSSASGKKVSILSLKLEKFLKIKCSSMVIYLHIATKAGFFL